LNIRSVLLVLSLLCSVVFSQGKWHEGNLKGLEDLTFDLNVKGIEDGVWEKRVFTFIELRLMEHGIEFVEGQMPKMVVDVSILDSRIEKTSSFLVMLSVYNYGISEDDYYRSMADTLITKKLMTSKVFSQEVIGQTTSNKIHGDVEKSINRILSMYLDQWYRDNPLKQF
jgi:hypothetical protein